MNPTIEACKHHGQVLKSFSGLRAPAKRIEMAQYLELFTGGDIDALAQQIQQIEQTAVVGRQLLESRSLGSPIDPHGELATREAAASGILFGYFLALEQEAARPWWRRFFGGGRR